MRIWDITPKRLCRKHLLGEHRELHALWTILTENKKGYSHHPETLRWRGKLKALYAGHDGLVKEMKRRSYNHNSPLNKKLALGSSIQKDYVNSLEEQNKLLSEKECDCLLE